MTETRHPMSANSYRTHICGDAFDTRPEAIELSWQSTPALWMAVREGLCWCEECRGKHAKGFGKTREHAVADLLEQESTFATGGEG